MIRARRETRQTRTMSYGPVQMLVIAFEGNKFRGEILPELDRLKNEGVVRILDLMIVRKDSSGAVTHAKASDLGWEEAVQVRGGDGRSGRLCRRRTARGGAGRHDRHGRPAWTATSSTSRTPSGSSSWCRTTPPAAVALIEHLWARPLLDAVARAQGFEMLNEWVEPTQIMSAGGSFARKHAHKDIP